MKPVIGVGAPSYTSGAHMWNGAAASLKPNPTTSSATPTSNIGVPDNPNSEMRSAIVARFVEPVAPYTKAMP